MEIRICQLADDMAYQLFGCGTGLFFSRTSNRVTTSRAWQSGIASIASSKVSQPWHVIFLKGIGANWLVCLAIWLGMSSNEMFGRLVGLWLPVMVFVTLGFEHSIANMFYIPMGIMSGADVTVWRWFGIT